MKKMKMDKYLFIAFGLVFLSVFALFKKEYATDTYWVYSFGLPGIKETMFTNGRYIPGLFAALLNCLNFSISSFYYTSFLMSIIFMSFAVYVLYTILSKHISKYKSILISFISVFNLAAIEYFLFIEKGTFAFSIFMSVLAVKFFTMFLQGKRWLIFFAFLSLILSALTYQIIPGLFIVLSLPFIVIYSKSLKSFIVNNVLAVSIYGSGTLLNYSLVKLTQDNQRLGNGIHISNIFKFYSFGTFKIQYILSFIGVFALIIVCVLSVRYLLFKERLCKKSILCCAKYIYLFLGVMAVTVLPFVFIRPEEVWFMFRVAYPIFSLPGTLLILIFFQPNSDFNTEPNKAGKLLSKLCIIAIIGFVVISLLFFNAMTFSRLKNNELDEEVFNLIYSEIENYEAETNNKITTITVYYDKNLTHVNPGVLSFGDCNVRAFSRNWSDVNIFSALSGRSFKRTYDEKLMNKDYNEYFSSKDWDSFSKDQLIFDGNTLHMCVY